MPTLLTGLIQFLFTSVMSILGVLLLLRAWVYVWAFSPRHPIVQLARRATDWLVEPLSKLIPRSGSYDWPSLVAALVAAVIMVLMQRVLTGMPYTPIGLVIAPLATVLRWALEMMSWGVFIWVVMTWLNPQSPMTYALGTLVDPFVRPVRKIIPMFGRFDLSPIVVIILANVLLTLVTPASHGFIPL